MKEIFEKIWELALPYQDKRNDEGHAEITLNYAVQLVQAERGDEDIVIPAIILHDIGWSQLPDDKRLAIFNPNISDEKKLSAALQHQNAAVPLAKTILNTVGYPPELTLEIVEIISQHDTRKSFISKNEGLVRDADKLWRFSEVGFAANIARTGVKYDLRFEVLDTVIDSPDYFYSETARQIARCELALRKKSTKSPGF